MKNLEKKTLHILIERLLSMAFSFSCNRVNVNCGYVIDIRFEHLFAGDLEKLNDLVAEFPNLVYSLHSAEGFVHYLICEDD